MVDKPKLTGIQYHEMLDRIAVLNSTLNEHLQHHPVSKLDKEISQLLEKAGDHLDAAYILTAKRRFEFKEDE